MLAFPMPLNCRACGKFVKRGSKHCGRLCYGKAQRGKCKFDRETPSKKAYIMIRHEDGSREYLHRYVYRTSKGPIPEGYIVHHKDENKYNNDPTNLELKREEEHTPQFHFKWRAKREKTYTEAELKRLEDHYAECPF